MASDGNNRRSDSRSLQLEDVCARFHPFTFYLWPLRRKWLQRVQACNFCFYCVCALVCSGWICGGDSSGARFWGPHGSNRWHSSEALPTDQVALHRVVVDHQSLSVSELALTQPAHVVRPPPPQPHHNSPPPRAHWPPTVSRLQRLRHMQQRLTRTRKTQVHTGDETCSRSHHSSLRSICSFSLTFLTSSALQSLMLSGHHRSFLTGRLFMM